jgi:N-methylhydantoinase A/oxoprolinase/acetone carboxylase beta subunit
VLSAVGIHLADIVQEAQQPAAAQLGSGELPGLAARLDVLAAAAAGKLRDQGFRDSSITTEKYLNLRWAARLIECVWNLAGACPQA